MEKPRGLSQQENYFLNKGRNSIRKWEKFSDEELEFILNNLDVKKEKSGNIFYQILQEEKYRREHGKQIPIELNDERPMQKDGVEILEDRKKKLKSFMKDAQYLPPAPERR